MPLPKKMNIMTTGFERT